MLHSFIAQLNEGLATESSLEQSEQVTDTLEKSIGSHSRNSTTIKAKTGEVELPYLFKSPSAETLFKLEPGKTASEKSIIAQTEFGKEVISKQLHDNALDQFERYLSEKNLLNISENTGFVHLQGNFQIIDFSYLSKMLGHEKLAEIFCTEQIQELFAMKETVANLKAHEFEDAQQEIMQFEKDLMNHIETIQKQFNHYQILLSYLNKILPVEAFIIMEGYLIPLTPEFLRQNGELLAFKYGFANDLSINILGKVGSIHPENTEIESLSTTMQTTNPFIHVSTMFNVLLEGMQLIQKGDRIISPIAIYFE